MALIENYTDIVFEVDEVTLQGLRKRVDQKRDWLVPVSSVLGVYCLHFLRLIPFESVPTD
jgi:hypothetical protein